MATWKKLVVSGSAISQLNNDANYLVSEDSSIILSGSFSGSFEGNGSGLTGVVAEAANPLVDGPGILDFSYNGNAAGVTVSVDSGSLAGNGLSADASSGTFVVQADSTTGGNTKPVAVGANGVGFDISTIDGDGLETSGGELRVDLDGSTIARGSSGIKVADGAIGTTQLADSVGNINENQFTGSFSGSFTGTTDLPDLTDGAGILDFTYDGSAAKVISIDSGSLAGNGLSADASSGTFVVNASSSLVSVDSNGVGVVLTEMDGNGIQVAGGALAVQADSTTGGNTKPVAVGANGVGFDISTIDGAGIGLSGGELVVNVDDSGIEINSDTLRLKDLGVTTGKINTDAVTTAKIAHSLGDINTHQFTGSFSGSFVGDGSGLTGIATTLTVDGDTGTQNVSLTDDDLQILGTTNEIVTAVTKVGNDVKATISLPDDVTIGQDLTITRDVNIQRNLVVQGTASFQHREDYDVADRFIRLASGSTAAGDGGIVIQQASAAGSDVGYGETFGFDSANLRFGVTSSFDASTEAFVPDAFMVNVIEGAGNDPDAVVSKYDKKGNIFVANNEDIYIYS